MADRLEQHQHAQCIDKPHGDRDIAALQPLKLQGDGGAVDVDIGDHPTERGNLFAPFVRGGDTDDLTRGVDAATAVIAITVSPPCHRRCLMVVVAPKRLAFEPYVVKVDHELGRRVKLRSEQRSKTDRPRP